MTVEIRSYSDGDLPALVAWWNRAFADRRNFFPVTEPILAERIIAKANGVERFEPAHFLLACEGDRLLGVAHVGVRSEEYCAAVFHGWPGGPQAYLALLAVAPDARRQGIGGRLFDAAQAVVAASGKLSIDGQCVNPFYGNSEAPFTPFFGTTEGISIPWEEAGTRRFFEKRGYQPRYRAVTMEAHLPPEGAAEGWVDEGRKRGFVLEVLPSRMPELGSVLIHARRLPSEVAFDAVTAHREGIVCALAIGYRMAVVDPARFGIYEVRVADGLRGQGLGPAVLAMLLRNAAAKGVRIAEALTIPDLSKGATEMYVRMGFREAASWAIY